MGRVKKGEYRGGLAMAGDARGGVSTGKRALFYLNVTTLMRIK